MSPNQLSSHQLLHRYLTGTITAPEEAELERRAASDPALADALLGVRAFPAEDHDLRVSRLREQVRASASSSPGAGTPATTRPLPYFRWAAVAAGILLLATVVFLLPRLNEGHGSDLAMTAEQPEPTESASPATLPTKDAPAPSAEAPASQPAPAAPAPAPRRPDESSKRLPATTGEGPLPQKKRRREANADRAVVENAPRVEAERATVSDPEADVEVAEEIASVPPQITPPLPADDAGTISPPRPTTVPDQASVLMEAAKPPEFLKGVVTNENGVPIVGALIRLPGQPIGELTDSLGNFRIAATGATSLIEVTHPDYDEEDVEVSRKANDLQISLDRKSFQPSDRPGYLPELPAELNAINQRPGYAVPVEGYGNLRRRLEAEAPEDLPPGKYKFSFLVNTDGTLTDFEFRGRPARAVMDYIGETLVRTSVWEIMEGQQPVRVYFKVVL